jgi:TetR/AcrR family transcriptional regulator, transcriptional repressor for nem operon
MPREKEFSSNDVLLQAADMFTRHGFAGTSMSMLTDKLGVAKQSLYNAFGDKEALYSQSLQALVNDSPGGRAIQAHTSSQRNSRTRITDFFNVLLSECSDPDHPGCMVSAGLLEMQPDSPLGQQLQAKWHATAELLRSTIEDGQRDGSIKSTLRSAELAQALMVAMAGLRVMSKAYGPSASKTQVLTTSLKHALSLLDH